MNAPRNSHRVPHNGTFVALFLVGAWAVYAAVYYAEVIGSDRPSDYWQVVLVGAISGSLVSAVMAIAYSYAHHWSLARKVTLVLLSSAIMAIIWAAIRQAFYTYVYAPTGQPVALVSGRSVMHGLNALLFWSALYFVYTENRIARENEMRQMKAHSLAQETQIKLLSYRLNPHFFFNTLNSIATLVLKNDTRSAHDMIVRLSDFLRHTIDHHPWRKVTLQQELQCVDQYLSIQQVRFQDRIKLAMEVPDHLLGAMVPNLILQPVAENAVMHTVGASADSVEISIAAIETRGMIRIEARNTLDEALARSDSSNAPGKGLANVRERLEAYYGPDAALETTSEVGCFSVVMILPLERSGEK